MNDELQGTFACSVCGVAEPHWHDVALINRRRVEEGVLRPAFESALFDLMPRMQELRVSAYGMRHKCFQKLGTGRETLELPKEYFDAKVEAMWQLFLRAHYAASAGVQGMSLQAKALRDPPEVVQAEYDRMVVRSAMRQATSALERLLAGTDETVTDRQAGRSAIEALRVAEQHVRGVLEARHQEASPADADGQSGEGVR